MSGSKEGKESVVCSVGRVAVVSVLLNYFFEVKWSLAILAGVVVECLGNGRCNLNSAGA
ncbi:hypothetical protein KKC08_03290 [Patescibacteria group bacterium]|nr:hypothetical protein [Patescibacteria group bacterium]